MAVNLNLTAPMLLTQAFAAGMVENKVTRCDYNFAYFLLIGINLNLNHNAIDIGICGLVTANTSCQMQIENEISSFVMY